MHTNGGDQPVILYKKKNKKIGAELWPRPQPQPAFNFSKLFDIDIVINEFPTPTLIWPQPQPQPAFNFSLKNSKLFDIDPNLNLVLGMSFQPQP